MKVFFCDKSEKNLIRRNWNRTRHSWNSFGEKKARWPHRLFQKFSREKNEGGEKLYFAELKQPQQQQQQHKQQQQHQQHEQQQQQQQTFPLSSLLMLRKRDLISEPWFVSRHFTSRTENEFRSSIFTALKNESMQSHFWIDLNSVDKKHFFKVHLKDIKLKLQWWLGNGVKN